MAEMFEVVAEGEVVLTGEDNEFFVVRTFEDLTRPFPGTVRWCSVCGEEEGSEFFRARCDTKGGE